MQEEIIREVAEKKKDVLGLLPTGGGKSVIFQVPALATEGICIVITPLIALMKDQVENLIKRGIKAVAIYSGMSGHEIDITLNNCIYGDIKFLYVSPERLGTEIFKARVRDMNVNLLAIDESHCISQWGYDFRPSYLKISELRNLLPEVPVLALTATATPDVVDDIQEKLLFKEKNALKKSFERKNLIYHVRKTEDKNTVLLSLINSIKGSGVVYVRSRKKTKETAMFLTKNRISADYYHAGLKNEERDKKQSDWKKNKTSVIVATNAFGMGIDKPDVRFVIHLDLPDSLEAYFQEAGRAGRDEKAASAFLLYDDSDITKLNTNLAKSFPPIDIITKLYNALGNFFQLPIGSGKFQNFNFNIFDFAKYTGTDVVTIYHSLKILESEGYIEYTDDVNHPSKVHFLVGRDDLYKFQVANASFDGFIKLLLRTYTGMFSDYIKVDESQLARTAKTTVEVIYKYLSFLRSSRIIDYIPKKTNPLIVYTEERLDDKSLRFSPDNYKKRKERYKEKIDSVIRYVTNDSKCRSMQLLEYFGEKNSYRCGECDACKVRNRLKLSRYEFDQILNEVKRVLQESPKSPGQLIIELNFNKEDVRNVVQWLIENNKIEYNILNKLVWK